jgi:chromosome segregation ATPase
VQHLKDELARLRRESDEKAKSIADRTSEITQQITEMTQKLKDQDEQIDGLRLKVRGHDARRARKQAKLEALHKREQFLRPRIEFLRISRSFPMYIEDLSSKIAALRRAKAASDDRVKDIREQAEELRREHREIKVQIRAKLEDVKLARDQSQSASDRLQHTGKEIAHTQKALADATNRLDQAKEQTQRLYREHEELKQQIVENRQRFEQDMADIDRCKAEFEANIAALRSTTDSEVTAYDERIQKLRHKLTYIKERDADPDMPRVDVDLRRQIERVRAYEEDLVKEADRCEQERKRLDVQIQQKTWDLQTLTMKTQPTPAVLALPEFQATFLLLKELVLQNMEVKVATAEMSERIEALKRENNLIRRRLSDVGV